MRLPSAYTSIPVHAHMVTIHIGWGKFERVAIIALIIFLSPPELGARGYRIRFLIYSVLKTPARPGNAKAMGDKRWRPNANLQAPRFIQSQMYRRSSIVAEIGALARKAKFELESDTFLQARRTSVRVHPRSLTRLARVGQRGTRTDAKQALVQH
jgi:hypothetical protein